MQKSTKIALKLKVKCHHNVSLIGFTIYSVTSMLMELRLPSFNTVLLMLLLLLTIE